MVENIWTAVIGSSLGRLLVITVVVAGLLILPWPARVEAIGVTSSTKNVLQIAILHWYDANLTTTFSVGNSPAGVAFDGANIWVVNEGDGSVTKIRANDGYNLGTFKTGTLPGFVAFDGANIWVTDQHDQTVTKLRASDGVIVFVYRFGSLLSSRRASRSSG